MGVFRLAPPGGVDDLCIALVACTYMVYYTVYSQSYAVQCSVVSCRGPRPVTERFGFVSPLLLAL